MVPEIGMGGFYSPHSDRYPVTVVAVSKSGRICTTRDDKTRVVSGYITDGSAEYEITPNPNGTLREWSRRKNGRWVQTGETMNGTGLYLGTRSAYYDPHY